MDRLLRTTTLAAALVMTAANATAQQEMLELPFFDDFSYIKAAPSSELWVAHGTTVCYDLPKNPPSTGAMLLDALDGEGKFYPNARYGTVSAADTVESQPINLNYPGDKSIWLSFYYQCGGYGDRPEQSDSLVLDFYSVPEKKWQSIKRYEGGKSTQFVQEMINITDDKYLYEGFRFRFRNYISLGSSLAPDLVSNCDHWLIDYVSLDINRYKGDTVYQDVSLTNTPTIKIGDYQQVPWKHYISTNKHDPVNYTILYRNNDRRARLLDSINLYLAHDEQIEKYALGTFNMPSYMDFENRNENFDYTFTSKSDTVANYEVKVRLVSDATSNDFSDNNEITVAKKFSNYYALDDGSAEAAYGLHGEGSDGAMIAVKFNTYVPDQMTGVYMYFCPVYKNQQADNFELKVWSCENGLPVIELASKANVSVPKDNTGKFVYIPLDYPIEVRDTFFVGWQKNETSIIAVGFDRNTSTPNHKFFNIGGDWKQSKELGQIMIRPVFADIKTATSELTPGQQIITPKRLKIYPNPASTHFTVEWGKDTDILRTLMIINARSGQVVKTIRDVEYSSIINTDDIPAGAYIIMSPSTGESAKILIIK
ncbi:MAG: T9SS type A sorting domain-containing protein [Bacteroidales bacterium]|nr:T9SS type A sorting domain-containing protein [Bacteroidales bacterium]